MTKVRIRSERIKWIDVCKGMGLLLVILGHLLVAGSSVAVWIFSFHIPLFFFLSGYLSKFESKNSRDSLKRILISLIVPYFIFVFIGLIISLIIPVWHPVSLNVVLYDVFYRVQPESLHVGQLWFLFCLAVTEILFLIAIKLLKKHRYFLIAVGFFAAIIAYVIQADPHFTQANRIPWKIDSAFMGFFFFSLGYYAKSSALILKIVSSTTLRKILFMTIALIINILFAIKLNSPANLGANLYGNLIYFIIAALSGIIFIICISKFFEDNTILLYMGKNTLSIFSSHSFFLYLYAFLLSGILGISFTIMVNIPLFLCFIGLIFVGLISLIVPIVYNNTIQKFILKLK